MTLISPRFAWHHALQAAAENRPPLTRASFGIPVRLFQQGLIDAGFPLPISTRKYGTVDGDYGNETVKQCIAFQRREGLGRDGKAGKNTLHRLDALLPGNAPALPPLPAPAQYVVPGTKTLYAQRTGLICWATVYCMMISWKDRVSYDVESAAQLVDPKYGQLVRDNKVMPFAEFRPFIRAAGMRLNPMESLTIEGWVSLLKNYGLLWVGQTNSTSSTAGFHSRIVEGVTGSGDNLSMMIMDPAGGRRYREGYDRFLFKYEEAYRRVGGQYFQIRHF
jgi:hypothetical protein